MLQENQSCFFVSSSVSTSTLSTLTFCYSTDGVLTVCTAKKKRSILENGIKESERLIAPSEPELNSSLDEPQDEEGLDRNGKFLMYWLTTTSTFTSVSYTA